MRIANIIEEGKLGGPQVRICAVAAALRGVVDTTVIMPVENSEDFRLRCEASGVPYLTLPISRITKEWRVALRYVLYFFLEVLRLVQVLRNGKYDLVHVSGGAWQYKGVIAAKLAGAKVLWHLNDTSLPPFLRAAFSLMASLADGYIYSAMRAKEYYKSHVAFGRPAYIINPPVDTCFYSAEQSFSADAEALDHLSGKMIIGTIANVSPIKGLEVLIDSAKILNKRFDNLAFVVIGSISTRQSAYYIQLQERAKNLSVDNLYFVGARADIRPWLSKFDVYVCSSHSETGPMTLWEAMAMEKAVVSTDVGDVSMYVQDGESGFVVDVGDSDAVVDRIARLIKDTTLRQEFGKRAREVAVRELDISRCAERHLAAYCKTLSR